jgi:hypothetical protein
MELIVGGLLVGGGVTTFLGWAFQGVGPSPEASAVAELGDGPVDVAKLNGLLFGGSSPKVALYCGAKVQRESYAPLAQAVLKELGVEDAGVLVLQSPFNVYAFKPATVSEVLEAYPSVTCVAGHSMGFINPTQPPAHPLIQHS